MKKLKRWLCLVLTVALFATSSLSGYMTAVAAPAGTEQSVEEDSQTPSTPTPGTSITADSTVSDDGNSSPAPADSVSQGDADTSAQTNEQSAVTDPPPVQSPSTLTPYENYMYGDPHYSGNYIYATDAEGKEIYEMYEDDLDAIISMAEEGMDLPKFFRGSIFTGFTLEDLCAMKADGYSFEDIIHLYLKGSTDIPDWLGIALYVNGPGYMTSMLDTSALPNTLTGKNWVPMSQYALGIIQCLGGSKSHGFIGKLKALGDDGLTYEVFCLSYGGSFKSGYVYQLTDYSNCTAPSGVPFTSDQAEMLEILVNVYLNMSLRMSYDYSATQLMMWYIINNVQSFDQLDQDQMFNDLAAVQRAINGDAPQSQQYLKQFLYGVCGYLQMYGRGEGLPYGDADAVEVHFWNSGSAPTAQNILSWSSGTAIAGTDSIPYVDNFYIEKTATTEYHVEITKESIITNELLEGIQLEVVESEASGYDLTYDIYKGTYSEDGTDYPKATVNPGSFGQAITESDPVPYMDDDITPSEGNHRIVLTTNESGYASTTFTHSHTFKEFYSKCYASEGVEVSYADYEARWQSVLAKAQKAPNKKVDIVYEGVLQTLTYDEIREIYDSQQVVYTQTEDEAVDTINSLYDAYCARTYTYTVTELDTYTRPVATDSNGNVLAEILLPKDGYRKDVQDATTIGSYEQVVKNGGTMIAGGKNDADPNTNEVNITNEPWYNQFFIHKTDLETGSQILYDTEFDIYEYYQYKVNLSDATQKLYPAKMLTQYMVDTGSSLRPEHIKAATLVVTDAGDNEVLKETLDVQRLTTALADTDSYVVDFATTYSGDYTADLQLTLDQSLDLSGTQKKYIYDAFLKEVGACTCGTVCGTTCADDCPVCKVNSSYCKEMEGTVTLSKLYQKELVTKEISSWDNDANTVTTKDGTVYTITYSTDLQTTTYSYTDATGTYSYTNTDDMAGIETITDAEGIPTGYTLQYLADVDTGVLVFGNGTLMMGEDAGREYIKITADTSNTYTLHYYVSTLLENGDYSYKTDFSISAAAIGTKSVDKNVSTDPADYTTWGQDNYEIVRVTPEIAKKMGWADTTIGMYTVHRLSATDQYCGTTFTAHFDESNKTFKYGYYEYGTLYYTQANQGKFAIVEKTAPADDTNTGYLGNYEDRDYTKLDDQSSKKNNDGAPYATADEMSTVKMVHYIDLCTDTNQYATYMLTDGYKEYDATYYTRYIESIKDERGNDVETLDGYDSHYYGQSSRVETIGLERYKLDAPMDDVLNTYWDTWFSDYLTRKSGITVSRNSEKTDAWMDEEEKTDVLHHFVGTTINIDSFDDNDSTQSDITYDGTYTNTNINYNSYAGEWAEALNGREGFNSTEYLQVGNVTYDNAAAEKEARYYNTEASVSKDAGYAFIDEREYGYIRFTKYDADAKRYVTGDLSENYEAGTDHADADLDGAVYSLYVSESCSFDVNYLEGTLNGTLFWAQPLNTGGYRLIFDADDNAANGFTDKGDNPYTDYAHAFVTADGKIHLDYYDDQTETIDVILKTATYYGIQHPDGQYGGAKHNGFYAVLEEQQVFIDTDNNGYADTWTLQDVTLYAGAKVASAVIENGELEIDGLYLGTYYLTEEIRDAITIYSTNNDDEEAAENRWLSFAAGYTADTDASGNPNKYVFSFPYISKEVSGTTYAPEQDYVHKDTAQVSNQQVVRGGSAQFNKITTNGESSSSNNTTGEALEGAGFTVYLISELDLIVDGTVVPAYSEVDGHELVEANHLVKLFDAAGNMVGYQFTKSYLRDSNMYSFFEGKYPNGYNLDDVNRLIYVKDRGYYYLEDILDAYRNAFYDNTSKKWDFTAEDQAIVRIYEEDVDYIEKINSGYDYVANHLNSGSPCEYYGVNGLSDGWVATGVKNEYELSEIFTNHYGNLRVPELSWGSYIMVETTTPEDVFSADPVFFTITDTSASENRSKKVTITDTAIVASLILVKRDAQSGQDVLKGGTSYRIWDYTNNKYVSKYLLGENGALSVVAQRVFTTDEDGRINAVASLECGTYRIEELSGPNGYHNLYWDYGNGTDGERLGGIGTDSAVATEDNMFQKYYGTMDFEVTTDRLFKASGIVSSDNLDYLYIGESYFNDELQGKLTISKTGEVLVGYKNTDNIEYADEYTDSKDAGFNYSKSMMRERSVFESMKDHYDLGTDEIKMRTISIDDLSISSITEVSHIASDAAGMGIAAIYTDTNNNLITMNGGTVYETGAKVDTADQTTFYPGATVTTPDNLFVYEKDGEYKRATMEEDTSVVPSVKKYLDEDDVQITDQEIIDALKEAAVVTTIDSKTLYAPKDVVTALSKADGYVMIVYEQTTDIYENAAVKEVEDQYIYTVSGQIMDTSYLVTDKNGTLITNDYGVLSKNTDGTYTLTYTEAIYDPDTNYNYILTLSDGSAIAVKLITGKLYLSKNNELVTGLASGGFSIEKSDGTTVTDESATITLAEENTGETFDFVYEERRLAGATYVIKAAEDIMTQDGGENYWFRKGDVVATVTTANDGELVHFAPVYNKGGSYDSTYYYGNSNGSHESLTKANSYTASEFATTGEVVNKWIASRMSSLDLSIFGTPAFTDETIYANTYYREDVQPIYRRFTKESTTAALLTTDYQTRLEAEAGLSSEGYQVVTQTDDGFMLTATESVDYKGATLTKQADYFLLNATGRSNEPIDIEVRESEHLFMITEVLDAMAPWAAGDYVERTAFGYKITHTNKTELGVDYGSTVDGAADLGFTKTSYYPNAVLYDNGNGNWTLYDEQLNAIAKVKSGILVTEAGGIVTKTADGYRVNYEKAEEITANAYVTPTLTITGASLTIKNQEYDLSWDNQSKSFKSKNGVEVTLASDYASVNVKTGNETLNYKAYDLLVEYELHYAQKEDIVRIEKDGTIGMVSIYLPLGSYSVEEIKAPYGFLINEQVQTVSFEAADQIKEIVFNTNDTSTQYTQKTMDIWESKGFTWFVGGINTIGEKLNRILGVNFFTWGTYGDGETAFFEDAEGFINFFNLRVKAWSDENVPKPKPSDEKVTISKKDITTLEELPGAKLTLTDKEGNLVESWTSTDKPHVIVGLKDGTYTLTEELAPDTYDTAESITFTVKDGKTQGTIVMYDAPSEKGVSISKQDITNHKELPGAQLILTDSAGKAVDSWTSTRKPHVIEDLADGKYTLTELTAPDGYEKAESITFTVKDGVAFAGDVVMYDAPEGKKVYLSKQDLVTNEELPGAKLILTNEAGKTVDSWTSTDEVHVIENLPDGVYTLTELTAPHGYEKAESITFRVIDGTATCGPVVMYDRPSDSEEEPEDDRHEESERNQWKLGVGIYKADEDTKESLYGAKFGLYTSDDIYNADGKLIVTRDTLLAVATTDDTGHANFAVDIALMSKNLDAARGDQELIYEKTISYTYDTFTHLTGDTYILSVSDCDDLLLKKQSDGTFRTDTGNICTIDETLMTVTYLVSKSIDGNTAANTGAFYIKELTPPDGYLYDDTRYDVAFVYDDQYTMYIPVYAKHENEPTKVTLTKMDLTGQEEVPGATIAVYKIKDVHNVDADGLISHADDNLILIDQWVSTEQAHETTGLLLSNTEWPRLSNQEVRENIYIFRELIPAAGYVRARDIEFKLYQLQGPDGWVDDTTKETYGYEVLTRMNYCDQEYESGSIISPNEHADSWYINGTATESTWDYSKVLTGYTEVKWLLVNKHLTLFFEKDTNKETIAKILQEEDFAHLTFDTVSLEFGGTAFEVDFYTEKQVDVRPIDSYLHFDQMWYTLDDIHVTMYDDTTKLRFVKQDIVTGEDVIGAKLEIRDEDGTVIDSWTTAADEDGNAIPHYIEGVLEVDKEYTLVETYAPTEDGYVKSNSVKFTVEDDGHIQQVVMQDDFTKLRISKADATTGKEVEGAVLELWSLDKNGKKDKLMDKWTTGEDGYDKDGYPNRHYIDYLPVGDYLLSEMLAPEGYLLAEDIKFTMTETGLLQKVQMLDEVRTLKVYKYRTGTTQFVKGATIKIYEVPEEYVKYLTDRIAVETDAAFVEPGTNTDFVENTQAMNSVDLIKYLTGIHASNTEHREEYETTLRLDYSMVGADLVTNRTFKQVLPKEITLFEDDLNTEFVVRDEGVDAFTYLFEKTTDGYTITVTFDDDYLTSGIYSTYNFYLEFGALISETCARAGGSLSLKFTDDVRLSIPAKEITEIDSSLTEKPVTIKLTNDDLRATIKTKNEAVKVPGLTSGWYLALETEAPSGYILDKTPQVFQIMGTTTEQALYFYNRAKESTPSGGGEPAPGNPEIGKLILKFGSGFSWNNVRTEDTGEEGSSIILTIENDTTQTSRLMAICILGLAAGCGITAILLLRRKKKVNRTR